MYKAILVFLSFIVTYIYKASLSGSVIDTITYTEILRTVPVQCHGDDTHLTFHDTLLFSLLILLVHISKFNVHGTLMTLPLRLALGFCVSYK